MGAPLKREATRQQLREHLDELGRLADTAGAEVVGELTQMLDRPHPGTYLGKGKLEELRAFAGATAASLVIFDDELTPVQGRNIEEALGTRVIDRAELILDIFATRARTSEAKMQVELAQLEYLRPRLTRMWTHLEKFRGGIGMRGPGETQLETDRRLIGHRIRVLKERLSDVQRARAQQRQARREAFKASLVGYTNAGKSSILRALALADEVFVEDRLFATLDPLTREVELGEQQRVLVTDTVGFIRKLPHDLVASFHATLSEIEDADLLLHVIDASHPSWDEQREVADEVLAQLNVGDKDVLHVFNKTDLLDHEEALLLQQRLQSTLPNSVFVSAIAPEGMEPLRRALQAGARSGHRVVEVRLPASDGRALADVYRMGEVLGQHAEGDAVVVRARLSEAAAGRLKRLGVPISAA